MLTASPIAAKAPTWASERRALEHVRDREGGEDERRQEHGLGHEDLGEEERGQEKRQRSGEQGGHRRNEPATPEVHRHRGQRHRGRGDPLREGIGRAHRVREPGWRDQQRVQQALVERDVPKEVVAVVGEVLRQVRVDELIAEDHRSREPTGLEDADDRCDENHRREGQTRPALPRPGLGPFDGGRRAHTPAGRKRNETCAPSWRVSGCP